MKISKGLATELLELYKVGNDTSDWKDFPVKFKLVHTDLIDITRWSHIHEAVYEDLDSGKFYRTTYRVGATECQDEEPYEYEKEVELYEVVPKEKTITIYEAIN